MSVYNAYLLMLAQMRTHTNKQKHTQLRTRTYMCSHIHTFKGSQWLKKLR